MPRLSTPHRAHEDAAFRILVVCTGNVCRSPLVAAVLRARLAQHELDVDVEVSSAGLQALVGAPADPAVGVEARRLGVDVSGHRGRDFAPHEAAASDLVILATKRQRSVAVELVPGIVRRAFTLLELDAVLADLDASDIRVAGDAPGVARWSAVVQAATRRRGPVVQGLAVDLADPYRASAEMHRAVADIVDAAASRIAVRLVDLAAIHQPPGIEDVS